MSKILSVIVPAYNVEKYLEKCLKSFEDVHALQDMEILVVNDGSTDKTAEIAEKFCRKYPSQYILYNKENGGHGSAINHAVIHAQGKYLKVVDADDWVDTAELSGFIRLLDKLEVDIVANDFCCIQDGTGKVLERRHAAKNDYHYGKSWSFAEAVNEAVVPIHSMTVKTEIVKNNPTLLDEHCFYEDMEFVLYPIPYCQMIYYDKAAIYQYRLGRNGQSVDIKVMQKRRDQHMRVIKSLLSYYKKHYEIQEFKREYLERGISDIIDNQYQIYLSMGKQDGIKEELKKFDSHLKIKYPGIYAATKKKSIWMIRKSNYRIFGIGALVYRILRGN